MSESQRRFQRYAVQAGSLSSQRYKEAGVLGFLRGWTDCKVTDLSHAGALVVSSKMLDMGSVLAIEITPKSSGDKLTFHGEVMNIGREPKQGTYRFGVKLFTPERGTKELLYLEQLPTIFKESV